MADFRRGIKAGIITGIVYIVISAILGAIYHNLLSIPYFIYAAGLTP
jgi:thiamine transporter ThiT